MSSDQSPKTTVRNVEDRLRANARKIVVECCAVRSKEVVVILSDTRQPARIHKVLFEAVLEAGGHPVVILIPASTIPGEPLPEIVNEGLKLAGVVIAPTSRSVFHSEGIRQARRSTRGTRILTISECTEDMLVLGGINADFPLLSKTARLVGDIFERGEALTIRTPAGTAIRASIAGRMAVLNTGMSTTPGELMGLPTVEASIAPVESSVEGRIVVDASCSGGIGIIEQPIELTLSAGKVRRIAGGAQARQLERILNETRSDDARQVAEIAVGLNPYCRITGRITEDEGKYGTCHMALGNNVYFGGVSDAPIHIDMVQWKPTVTVDGQVIFVDGALRIPGVDPKVLGLVPEGGA